MLVSESKSPLRVADDPPRLKQCMSQAEESKHAFDQAQLTLSHERLSKVVLIHASADSQSEVVESLESAQKSLELKVQELQKALEVNAWG